MPLVRLVPEMVAPTSPEVKLAVAEVTVVDEEVVTPSVTWRPVRVVVTGAQLSAARWLTG